MLRIKMTFCLRREGAWVSARLEGALAVGKPQPHRHSHQRCTCFTSSLVGWMSLGAEQLRRTKSHLITESQREHLSFVVEAALTITWSEGKKSFLNGAKLATCCLTPLSIAFEMSSSYASHIYISIFRQAQGTSGSSTFIFNRIMES